MLSVINAEIEAEEERKESIERRGLAVVSTSGTLVTALFALGALVAAQDRYHPPTAALIIILFALVFFVAAAVQGLSTNIVGRYQRIDVERLRKTAHSDLGTLTAVQVRRFTAETNADVLIGARYKNDDKATQLKLAIRLEVIAVLCLAGAVAVQILDQITPSLLRVAVWISYFSLILVRPIT